MDEISHSEHERPVEWADVFYTGIFRAKVLLNRFWWIFLVTISLGISIQAYRVSREPSFVSYARMIVSGRVALPESAIYTEELSNFFGTQIELMESSRVRNRARERVLAHNPKLNSVGVLLSASLLPDTSIFILKAEGPETVYTQKYLEAVLEEYMNLRREMRSQTSQTSLLAIADQIVTLEDEIEEGENDIVDFQKQNNVVFIQEQGTIAGTKLVELKNKMADLKTQFRLLDTLSLEQHMQRSSSEHAASELMRISTLDTSEVYLETKRQIEQLKAVRDEFSIYMKPRHPKIIQLDFEIERAENLLEIYRLQSLAKLDETQSVLLIQINNLEKDIDQWEETALDNGRLLAEFRRLQSGLDRNKNLHERLLDRIQSIDVNLNLEQETVTILENASNAYMVPRQIAKNTMLGGLAGLAAGVGLLFLIGALDNRVVSAEDLSQRFAPPVLGIIPREKKAANGKIEILKLKDPRHLFAEAYRTLRSSLLFMERGKPQPRIFVVTSAVPSEGKTTVAANLAVALAFANARTLLVDADLRRGNLHKTFETDNSKGLSELLQSDLSVDDFIHKTGVDCLDFIPCGKFPDRPGELLLSKRVDDILSVLRERYDFVIFDSAPILAADDTTSFAAKADAVLFTVFSGLTQVRQVKATIERLEMRGATLKGFVLNAVDIKGSDYYYYRKYYSYYAPEKSNSEV